MKKVLLGILSLLTAAALAGSLCACAPRSSGLRADATVTLFSTNDLHGFLAENEETGAIGMQKVAEIKASTPNAVLVDAGDATQGASFASISQGEDVISMMNAAKYDVMAAGNHDFDYGADRLLENAEHAAFPILAANVRRNGGALLGGSAVIERAEYSIGFIGLTTVSTATSANPDGLAGVTFENETAWAMREIAELSDRTDAIVLVCHLGDNAAAVPCTGEQLLGALSDAQRSKIAAVIDGHSHTVEEKTVEGIPVVQAGVNFTHIGKVIIGFKDGADGAEFTSSGEVMDYAEAAAYPVTEAGEEEGERVGTLFRSLSAVQDQTLGEFLGVMEHPLIGGYVCYDYAESRIVETEYGDFVTDAFRYDAELFAENNNYAEDIPVLAVENGGGISQSLPTWHSGGSSATVGDVMNAFNHGNLVEVLLVSPAELFNVIEAGLTMTGQDETGLLLRTRVSGSFIQCSGFSYTYDPAGETGHKVTEIELDGGSVLDRSDTRNRLLLATNGYVASSFSSAQKEGELGGEDMIVVQYFDRLRDERDGVFRYTSPSGRIRIAGDKSPETYTVRIPVNGENSADRTFRLSVDGGEEETVVTDAEGCLVLTLKKGAHLLRLAGAANFVYVNNYSGTGVQNTREGYYKFSFDLSVG